MPLQLLDHEPRLVALFGHVAGAGYKNAEKLHVTAQGATLLGTALSVKFPEGSGYQRTTVTLQW